MLNNWLRTAKPFKQPWHNPDITAVCSLVHDQSMQLCSWCSNGAVCKSAHNSKPTSCGVLPEGRWLHTTSGEWYCWQAPSSSCPPYVDAYVQGNWLRSVGVKKGDAVAIYMPMVCELPIAMLACARIGAVHSIIFGGFSAESLAQRMENCK